MRDSTLRMAQQIQRRLQGQAHDSHQTFVSQVGILLMAVQSLQSTWRQFTIARQRGWTGAGPLLLVELFRQGEQFHGSLASLLSQEAIFTRPEAAAPLSLREIYNDLRQLEEEFEPGSVEFIPGTKATEPMLVATTSSIELDGIDLGPFAIELPLRKLHPLADAACFRLVAREPNPAASNSSITHPHVSDGLLCAGDAAAPISQALRQGRITDAFVLVRSVLQTYNAHSPYVALDDWSGIRCQDCGEFDSGDGLSTCSDCDRDCCDYCLGTCALCDRSVCEGCLERDTVSNHSCCSSCRSTCARCGRIVDSDSFIDETGLCPGCDQLARQEAEEQDSPDTALAIQPAGPVETKRESGADPVPHPPTPSPEDHSDESPTATPAITAAPVSPISTSRRRQTRPAAAAATRRRRSRRAMAVAAAASTAQ